MSAPPAGAVTVADNRWDLAPAATRAPRVTVVVTHYEQPAELARTLAALRGQTHPTELLEVVVADDGSSEPPRVLPGVRLVSQTHDGFGAARIRNAAAAVAGGDVLVLLDADTTPEPDYVARIARLPAVLPEAVVLGRRRHAELAGMSPGDDVRAHGLRHELRAPEWLAEGYRRSRDLLDADETSHRLVIGAVIACSAWMYAETGGMDESFTAYGGEDLEWAHRAWTHGAVLAHEPTAVAWHDGPDRADRPGWGRDAVGRERLLGETLTLADRVPVRGSAPRALLGRTASPLVTLDPHLGGDALVVTVDDLLAAWPRAAVLTAPHQHDLLLGDPRVVPHPTSGHLDAPAARSADLHLHVARAVVGDPAAWRAGAEPLHGVRAHGAVEETTDDDRPAVRWTSLRAERRALRWGEPTRTVRRRTDLAPLVDDSTAQAWFGGWHPQAPRA